NNVGTQFVELIRLHGLGAIAHVRGARAVCRRKLVIQPNGEVIFIGDLLPGESEDSGIAVSKQRPIRKWIEGLKEPQDRFVYACGRIRIESSRYRIWPPRRV